LCFINHNTENGYFPSLCPLRLTKNYNPRLPT
jgi:hypothetical protein